MAKLISVIGAGESGVGAALLAKAKGYDVFVSDKGEIQEKYRKQLEENAIPFESGSHNEALILTSAEVVKSPGISDKAPLIKALHDKQIPVISEIEFAARFSRAKFIAITGSNGKTTTTLLTYHLLKKLGLNVGLAGNIGESLAKQVIEDAYDYYVLELSSFQLDGVYDFHAHIAVLLNITPDHLDRYEYQFQNYIDSKFRIIQNMQSSDHFIYWQDDAVVAKKLESLNVTMGLCPISFEHQPAHGAYCNGEKIFISTTKPTAKAFEIDATQLPIQGKHNKINASCALLVASLLGFDEQQFVAAMSDFKNASHRLEFVAEIKGVRYINDSKATNVDSVFYALDSMKNPVVLIAGGVDKGNDYTQIEQLVKDKVKAIVCMGVDNSKLYKAFDNKVKLVDTHSLQEAVTAARTLASAGDVVLLSPACASFDLFKNYEDRGEQFKNAVLANL